MAAQGKALYSKRLIVLAKVKQSSGLFRRTMFCEEGRGFGLSGSCSINSSFTSRKLIEKHHAIALPPPPPPRWEIASSSLAFFGRSHPKWNDFCEKLHALLNCAVGSLDCWLVVGISVGYALQSKPLDSFKWLPTLGVVDICREFLQFDLTESFELNFAK